MKAPERFDLKKDFSIKLRFIYLPFLIAVVLSVVSYTYLHYLLDIKYQLISISDDIINFWFALLLTGVVWLFFLRKRIQILNPNWNNLYGVDFIHLIAVFSLVIPLLISQSYLVERFAKVETADKLSQITEFHKNDYYQIKELLYDKSEYGVYFSAETSGRYNENLNYYANYVVPIKVAYSNDKFWLSIQFFESTKSSYADFEKEKIWKRFTERSWQDFLNFDLNKYLYLQVIPPSDLRKKYKLAIANSELGKSISKEDLIIFRGTMDSYANRFEGEKSSFKGFFFTGIILFFVALLFTHVVPKKYEEFITDKPNKSNDTKSIIGYIIPQGSHFSTSLLSIINVSMFIIMVAMGVSLVHPLPNELMEFGALRRAEVLDGQYWRLLTSEFIHIGIFHLAMNLVGFIIIGVFIESSIGRWRMLVLYISTAIGASLMSIWFHDNAISAGASGAIMGMIGYMIATMLIKRNYGLEYPLLILVFGGGTFFMGFVGNADNASHLGGLLTGFVVGIIILLIDKNLEKE